MSIQTGWRAVAASRSSFTNTISPPSTTIRSFSAIPHLSAPRQAGQKKDKSKTKKKKYTQYMQRDLSDLKRFALCDAMRFIKAFEIARDPTSSKYDLAIRVKTNRDGPILRNQIRLPHAVKKDLRIAVICPPDSPAAKAAQEAGATYVGEEVLFEKIKKGDLDFDRCVAHPDSLPKVNSEGLGRILGPRGLMPSAKLGTVSEDIGPLILNMKGGSMYKERYGVVRMVVGHLAFTPEQLRDNIGAMVKQIKEEAANFEAQFPKSISEVVLSSTNAPGFSLTGQFRSKNSLPLDVLSSP